MALYIKILRLAVFAAACRACCPHHEKDLTEAKFIRPVKFQLVENKASKKLTLISQDENLYGKPLNFFKGSVGSV